MKNYEKKTNKQYIGLSEKRIDSWMMLQSFPGMSSSKRPIQISGCSTKNIILVILVGIAGNVILRHTISESVQQLFDRRELRAE